MTGNKDWSVSLKQYKKERFFKKRASFEFMFEYYSYVKVIMHMWGGFFMISIIKKRKCSICGKYVEFEDFGSWILGNVTMKSSS